MVYLYDKVKDTMFVTKIKSLCDKNRGRTSCTRVVKHLYLFPPPTEKKKKNLKSKHKQIILGRRPHTPALINPGTSAAGWRNKVGTAAACKNKLRA